ncbi:ParB/RepB/Spo0J family partition protein [Bifidobacterium sp. UMB1197]|nr:ParB/RepB/Spo0J family partition protein [Bifidobacterium sp. UMB1197]
MSASKSRLGKGLGALFPTLPGEDDFNGSATKKIESVSHETNEKKDEPLNAVSRETNGEIVKKDIQESVPRETKSPAKVPSVDNAISPHLSQKQGKNAGVSRETVPSIASKNKHSAKRTSMPSIDDVTRPIDFFFGDSASKSFVSSKQIDEENSKNSAVENDVKDKKSGQTQELKPIEGGYLEYLDPSDIVPNAHQPRTIFDEEELQELSASIKEVGVLQPIVVRKIKDAGQGDLQKAHYELIMGERRWRATQLAGLKKIPAIVRTTSDENMLRDALLENLHRVALNPLEEAAAYAQMIDDFGLTQIQLSKSVSKSRPQIANTLRLLNLPASVQKHIASGVLSAGHARALLALASPEEMEALAKRIIAEGLSVRSTEEIVSIKVDNGDDSSKRNRVKRNNKWASSLVRKQLEERFATKVAIKGTENHGRIEIVFSSPEEMQRIIGILVNKNS